MLWESGDPGVAPDQVSVQPSCLCLCELGPLNSPALIPGTVGAGGTQPGTKAQGLEEDELRAGGVSGRWGSGYTPPGPASFFFLHPHPLELTHPRQAQPFPTSQPVLGCCMGRGPQLLQPALNPKVEAASGAASPGERSREQLHPRAPRIPHRQVGAGYTLVPRHSAHGYSPKITHAGSQTWGAPSSQEQG